MKKHRNMPRQPSYTDGKGTVRFVSNRIVEMLLDTGTVDLNRIAVMAQHGKFTKDEQSQFAQLIGYSLDGFSELEYANMRHYDAAIREATTPKP